MLRSTRRLGLESLETRLTPAGSVSFLGGVLRVSGDNLNNTISLTQTTNKFAVVVDGASLGSYLVTGGIIVNSLNGNDLVELKLTGNFGGTVGIDTGLGNDSVNITGTGTAQPRIQGTTTVSTGLGDDVVNLGSDSFSLGLTAVNVRADIGADKLNVRNATIAGNLITYGTDSVVIGQGSDGRTNAKSTVAGSVIVNNASEGLPGSFILAGGSVLGSLTYIGGGGGNSVNIIPNKTAQPLGLPVLLSGRVAGNTTLVLGAGNNTVNLNLAELNGALSATSGPGNDLVNLLDGSVISGSASLYLGDGNNSVLGADNVVVAGDVSLRTGNGDDLVSGFGNSGFDSDLFGRFDLSLGNGANVFSFEGVLAGRLTYVGGGGDDNVTITGAYAFSIDVRLGAGNDTFTFGANTSVGSAYIDFGFGDDIYNDGGNSVGWPMTIVGL